MAENKTIVLKNVAMINYKLKVWLHHRQIQRTGKTAAASNSRCDLHSTISVLSTAANDKRLHASP